MIPWLRWIGNEDVKGLLKRMIAESWRGGGVRVRVQGADKAERKLGRMGAG